jgi:tRNA (guanine37-N1)-methyltransferase
MQVDYIGDAAVLSLNGGEDRKEAVEAILSRRKDVRIVLNKISKVEGDRRVARLELLAGEDTIVTCRESGFIYRFDIMKDFFNARLDFERRRIPEQVTPGEVVLVPFAGVGPFAIPLAARGCRVVAIEKNADACRWLQYNAKANKVHIDIIDADARSMRPMLSCLADRAVVPTPYGMDDILETITDMVKAGGIIHFYTFRKKYQIEGLIGQYESSGLEVLRHRRCGNVAPGVSRWAFDLRKER